MSPMAQRSRRHHLRAHETHALGENSQRIHSFYPKATSLPDITRIRINAHDPYSPDRAIVVPGSCYIPNQGDPAHHGTLS